jgi:hypothetical protein
MNEINPILGTLHHLEDTQTFASGFSKREFVVKMSDGKFDQFIKFEALKERIDQLDPFKVGDEITVSFNLRGREHNGKYYTNLVAWRVDKAEKSANDPGDNYRQKANAQQPHHSTVDAGEGQEIPF